MTKSSGSPVHAKGVTIKQVAKDFGISESCLTNWMTQA